MQNPALLIGGGTVACKKIPEDKRLRQLGKQSSMANTDDTDSQDTADGTPSTTSSNVIPPRKKKKRLQKHRLEWEKKHVAGKSIDNVYKAHGQHRLPVHCFCSLWWTV